MLDQNNRPHPWTVLESKTRVKDRWIDMRTDKCRATNGDIVDYHVLNYSNWVNIIAFDPQMNVILVDEYRHGIGQPVVGLPGGVVDQEDGIGDDEAALAAARRELLEETGYIAKTATRILKSMANPALQNNWVYSYVAFNAVDGGIPAFDEGNGEFCLTVKHDLVDLLHRATVGDLPMQAMHIAALWSCAYYILRATDLPTSVQNLQRKVQHFVGD